MTYVKAKGAEGDSFAVEQLFRTSIRANPFVLLHLCNPRGAVEYESICNMVTNLFLSFSVFLWVEIG